MNSNSATSNSATPTDGPAVYPPQGEAEGFWAWSDEIDAAFRLLGFKLRWARLTSGEATRMTSARSALRMPPDEIAARAVRERWFGTEALERIP